MEQPNSNIETFNRICLHLFSELYDAFPVPVAVNPSSMGLSATPENLDYEGAWGVMTIAVESIDFLAQEGFLTKRESMSPGELSDVRLTMKGLAILGIPISLNPDETQKPAIEKIKTVMGKGAEQFSNKAIQAVISEIFKLAIN